MGSENVARVGVLGATGKLAGLSRSAVLVLTTMAAVSLDRGNARVESRHYFAGWELLAVHLGYSRADIDGPRRDTIRRLVARAVAELVAAGLIRRVGRTGPNGNRVWELTDLWDVYKSGAT